MLRKEIKCSVVAGVKLLISVLQITSGTAWPLDLDDVCRYISQVCAVMEIEMVHYWDKPGD